MNLNSLEYLFFNERDIETPAIINFIQENKKDITSILDIGAHYSYATYASQIRNILPQSIYDGVDPRFCSQTNQIVNNFITGNVLNVHKNYDCVTAISTFEHIGIHPNTQDNYRLQQKTVISHSLQLANKFCLFTFPYGKDELFENEYSNFTMDMVKHIESSKPEFQFSSLFFFNEFPQMKEKWISIPQFQANQKPLLKERGVQCVAVVSGKIK